MTMMRTDELREYHEKIIRPLIDSIEKAGGTDIVAHKARMSQARLKTILYKNHTMNVSTLMQLCSALNITLVFMDTMSEALKAVSHAWEHKYITREEALDLMPKTDVYKPHQEGKDDFSHGILDDDWIINLQPSQKDKEEIEPLIAPEMPEIDADKGIFYDFELNRLHPDVSNIANMTQEEYTQYLKDNNIDVSAHPTRTRINKDKQCQ